MLMIDFPFCFESPGNFVLSIFICLVLPIVVVVVPRTLICFCYFHLLRTFGLLCVSEMHRRTGIGTITV